MSLSSVDVLSIKVRAASVTALAKFGVKCPQLRMSVETLLKRCLLDSDDEVRDRAAFYLSVLRSGDSSVMAQYIVDVPRFEYVLVAC